jgi:hypothetical protein
MLDQASLHAEPVPTASQLAVLPFLAGVQGYLETNQTLPGLRLTVHRVMSRAGQGYLQQLCAYLGPNDPNWRTKVGRAFPVTQGIIGAAFKHACIWRTKLYQDLPSLRAALSADAARNNETINVSTSPVSFLAIPFIGSGNQPVLILYAECAEFNFFADDTKITHLRSMSAGFCHLFDWLEDQPFDNIRNFPLQKGIPVLDKETVYPSIQEPWRKLPPPHFSRVFSFNFENL